MLEGCDLCMSSFAGAMLAGCDHQRMRYKHSLLNPKSLQAASTGPIELAMVLQGVGWEAQGSGFYDFVVRVVHEVSVRMLSNLARKAKL